MLFFSQGNSSLTIAKSLTGLPIARTLSADMSQLPDARRLGPVVARHSATLEPILPDAPKGGEWRVKAWFRKAAFARSSEQFRDL